MAYIVIRKEASLAHHGIQGQKWGVRKGPPYPLEYDQHTGAEKKLNTKAELSKYDNELGRYKNQEGGPTGKQMHKELGKVYKKIRADEHARAEDIKKSRDAEVLNNYTKFQDPVSRAKELSAIREKYNKAAQWNSEFTKAQREHVHNKLIEIYGDQTESQRVKYQRGKIARRVIGGVLGTAAMGGAIAGLAIANKRLGMSDYDKMAARTNRLKDQGISVADVDYTEISRIPISRI